MIRLTVLRALLRVYQDVLTVLLTFAELGVALLLQVRIVCSGVNAGLQRTCLRIHTDVCDHTVSVGDPQLWTTISSKSLLKDWIEPVSNCINVINVTKYHQLKNPLVNESRCPKVSLQERLDTNTNTVITR